MKKPIEVACALIEREGRVLVAQRPPGKSLGGKWEFPGGKIEAGESGAEALTREIREELAIDINVGEALPAVTHDYGTFAIRLWPFVCALREGEPHPHEHTAVRWLRAEEITCIDLAAADKPVIAHYLDFLDGRQTPTARTCTS